MSATKAPPPGKRTTPTEAEKLEAASKVAAALGNTNGGVTASTGEVSAEAVKAKSATQSPSSSERAKITPPPPSKKPAPPPSKGETKAPPSSAQDPSSESVLTTLGTLVANVGEIRGHVAADLEGTKKAVSKVGSDLSKLATDVRDGLAALLEGNTAILNLVRESAGNNGSGVPIHAPVNHGHVRAVFSSLPDAGETAWLDEWSERVGEAFDIPPEEVARIAGEFGFTYLYESDTPEDSGWVVSRDYEGEMGA